MKTKKFSVVLIWIFYPIVIIMIFAQLLTSLPYMAISKGFYETHELIDFDHDYVAKQLIDYLNYRHDDLGFGPNDSLEGPIMDEAEIKHMVDVKNVYTLLRIVASVGLIMIITLSIWLWKKDKNMLYYAYKNVLWVPLAFIIFVGTWIVIDFSRIFTWFHLVLFPQGGWELYPNVLILIVPWQFWMVSGVIVLLGTLLTLVLTVFLNGRIVKNRL